MPLSICVACNRHIAPDAKRCPFCRTTVGPSSVGAERKPRPVEGGLRRGSLLAVGIVAASVTGFTGCNEDGPGADVVDSSTPADAGIEADASEPTDAAPAVDADEWIPTPIYEAIPPRF